jgi:hypothetical protein
MCIYKGGIIMLILLLIVVVSAKISLDVLITYTRVGYNAVVTPMWSADSKIGTVMAIEFVYSIATIVAGVATVGFLPTMLLIFARMFVIMAYGLTTSPHVKFDSFLLRTITSSILMAGIYLSVFILTDIKKGLILYICMIPIMLVKYAVYTQYKNENEKERCKLW